MDEEIAVVEQNPLRGVVPLDVQGAHADLEQAFLDGVGNRLHLALVAGARDHEVIGERGHRLEMADAHVLGLGVVRRSYGLANAGPDIFRGGEGGRSSPGMARGQGHR